MSEMHAGVKGVPHMIGADAFRVIAGSILEDFHEMGGQGCGGGSEAVLLGQHLQDSTGRQKSPHGLHEISCQANQP